VKYFLGIYQHHNESEAGLQHLHGVLLSIKTFELIETLLKTNKKKREQDS
jgi:hypothetical protein